MFLPSSSFSTANTFHFAVCVLGLLVGFRLFVVQVVVLLRIFLVSHRCVTLIIQLTIGDIVGFDELPDIVVGPVDDGGDSFESGIALMNVTVSDFFQLC